MISPRIRQQIADFDEVVDPKDPDFAQSGLKTASVIRVGRLLVIESTLLPGAIGKINIERLQRVRSHLAAWLLQA